MSQIREIIDSFPGVYICWKDHNSIFRGCNNNFAALFGKTPQDMIGVQDTIEAHVQCDKEVLSTGEAKKNLRESIETPTGVKMSILTQKGLWKDAGGQTLGIVVCFIQDPFEQIK